MADADEQKSEILADALRRIADIVDTSESDPDSMLWMVGEIARIATNACDKASRL